MTSPRMLTNNPTACHRVFFPWRDRGPVNAPEIMNPALAPISRRVMFHKLRWNVGDIDVRNP